MARFLCIHGHFYQPPRENPWLEAVELEDSAYPYHDWNERITAQCYEPNTVSRILDAEEQIIGITNNYAKISFNFGPTLLAWLEQQQPETYQSILDADRMSQTRFSGHGSAIAQAYNHMILPLANDRDRHTQVRWGIRDFEHRFNRKPEGMWLPETAVDIATLEELADQGIKYTILAPSQAGRVRKIGEEAWQDVTGGQVDPVRSYLQHLPSGKTIVLYFYDGPVAQAVAFEGLLSRGELLTDRLLNALPENGDEPQLMHIATDGETYGHHHRFGDMALSYALNHIESNDLAQITNYGEHLEEYPPAYEVEIIEQTSWSCVHGIERWRSDCGCNSGRPVWRQRWRGPLREALDWLRDAITPFYQEQAGKLLKDPWAARDDYIDVVLHRSGANVERFLQHHATHKLSEAEQVTALKLLEIQRHAMLMYTSCGWFFDDLSGIETVQVIQYAGRALQLAEELFKIGLEAHFLELLETAESNLPALRNGRTIFERMVRPAQITLLEVAGHYAVSTLFEEYSDDTDIYCYNFVQDDLRKQAAGRAKLHVGKVTVRSRITREHELMTFAVLYIGDHNLSGGVRPFQGEDAYEALTNDLQETFERADFPDIIRVLDKHFGDSTYSVRSLFRDQQRKALNMITSFMTEEAQSNYQQIYDTHAPLLRFLSDVDAPVPKALRTAAELVIESDLQRALVSEEPDVEQIRKLYEDATGWGIQLDMVGIEYELTKAIELQANAFGREPLERATMQKLDALIDLALLIPAQEHSWKAQNCYYHVLTTVFPVQKKKAESGDAEAQAWVELFRGLGEKLRVRLD